MNEDDANKIAPVFGGRTWQPYPGIWLLVIRRDDGSLVVVDQQIISLYDDELALEEGEPRCEIRLSESALSEDSNESLLRDDL